MQLMLFSFVGYMQHMGPSGKSTGKNINNTLLIKQEDTNSIQQIRYEMYLLNFPLVRTTCVPYGIFLSLS